MHTGSHDQAITLDGRFTGLPAVAHGGYVAGVIAGALDGTGAEVRLRRPVPTGRRLRVERTRAGVVELRDGEALLAQGTRADVSLDVPPAISLAQAEAASQGFLGVAHHPVPGCLVCGTGRPAGDGLRIFPGPVAGRRLVAAPWVPRAETANGSGRVAGELVSAALDCMQLWALIAHSPADTDDLVVTASLETRLARPVRVGEPHVVVGWPIGREGRTWLAGAALFGPGGELCAVGRQAAAIASWGVPLGRPRGLPDRTQTTEGDRDGNA
jgi:acyl-coenzyme A thioesterase PaaI-like protein